MGRGAAVHKKDLAEYASKRDFTTTPEPAPGARGRTAGETAGARSFMVHKHDASRLHYDVRLEVGGVLVSWAVPKGPSYDPATRRLAVRTEDHPLEYGGFEGRIPDAEYGGGDSLIWDRGTFDTVPPGEAASQLEKGHLVLELAGSKLQGRWHLVRTGRGAGPKQPWLFFKGRDGAADPAYDVVAERPESVVSGRVVTRGPERASVLGAPHPKPLELLGKLFPPMLARLASGLSRAETYELELKYDGIRALSAISGGRVAMRTRNDRELSERYPRIAAALREIVVGEAVIDGEIVVLDERGAPRFDRVITGHAGEALLVAFDILWLDGEDLRARPLEARRDLLQSVVGTAPETIRLVERVGDGTALEAALATARARGFEGVVAKRRGSPYEPGRSSCWLKLKVTASQELAVVGFTPMEGSPRQLGALLLAVAERGSFRYAGKVGTGFSADDRRALRKALATIARDSPPVVDPPRMRGVTWVEPRVVAEVRFGEWTPDGRLRHPSFAGVRPDKSPEECVRELPLEPGGAPGAGEPKSAEHAVRLTHPERVVFPRDGITKADVAAYYDAVSPALLAALADRPLSIEHFHRGIDEEGTFRQHAPSHTPAWIRVVEQPARTRERPVRRVVVDSPEALRWLVQNGAVTLHASASRAAAPAAPDWVVFDLDPADEGGFSQALRVAVVLRRLFDELSLPSVPKTSGGRGLHVLVPLSPGATHEGALAFALQVGRAVERMVPEATLERRLRDRRGRLYLDCLQNGQGKTLVAPYSLRAIDGAPVSAPLRWGEVAPGLTPERFHLRSMPERLARVGDIFARALEGGSRLPSLR